MTPSPRFNFAHRKNPNPHMQTERMEANRIAHDKNATTQLLKAQLLTGQHTLDKKRFVDVAKHHGWILQIPERLLV